MTYKKRAKKGHNGGKHQKHISNDQEREFEKEAIRKALAELEEEYDIDFDSSEDDLDEALNDENTYCQPVKDNLLFTWNGVKININEFIEKVKEFFEYKSKLQKEKEMIDKTDEIYMDLAKELSEHINSGNIEVNEDSLRYYLTNRLPTNFPTITPTFSIKIEGNDIEVSFNSGINLFLRLEE